MPLRILLFTAIIFPLMVFSQANYKAGYVITDAGDTLKGLINYLEWDNNPSTIKFQQQPGTTVASITAATVKEVGISGFGVYQRFDVPVTMFKVNVESISDTANTPALSKALFLKLLLKGDRLNLYSYSDNIKMRFYVLNNKKTTPEELLIIRTRQDMQEQTHDVYRLQLLQIAAQLGAYTSKLESQMQSVNYSENSLRNAISAINTSNENIAGVSINVPKKTSYFVGIGLIHAPIKYKGASFITADGMDANGNNRYKEVTTTNITARIAAGINFHSKLWIRPIAIKAEVSAYRFSSSTKSYTKYNNLTTAENHYTYNLDGWCFTLNPQLLYKVYHTNSLNAYVGTGLGINILATSKNSLYKEGINQPLTFNETTTGFLAKNLNFTLTARAGIVVNQTIDFYIYTSTPAKYSAGDAEDFSVKSRVLALCASYIF